MKLTLALFCESPGVLTKAGTAGFLRATSLKPGVVLDWAGVEVVSAGFLEALLGGHGELEALLRGAENVSRAVEVALRAWRGVEEEARPEVAAVGVTPGAAAREIQGGRYTPTRLTNALRENLRAYIESAWPLKDPPLIRARRALLEEGCGGRLLAQEPYLETTPRYPSASGGWGSFGLPEPLGAFLSEAAQTVADPSLSEKTLLYPVPFAHQAEAVTRFVRDGQDVIVATGTGSGKTECFLIPMLCQLALEAARRPASFARPGVRALVLYPMNALVNDQLARLRLLLGAPSMRALFARFGGRHPRFGMYTGRTPYPGPRSASGDRDRVGALVSYYLGLPAELEQELRARGRYPAKDLRAFFAEHLVKEGVDAKGKPRTSWNWDKRLLTGPEDSELLTRQEMVRDARTGHGVAPDVLVTNYSMLEYMLMRPFERPIFDQTARWLREDPEASFLLVVDEAHMYRGAPGAEVSFLLRRLRARLGLSEQPERLRVICTSASLGAGAEAQARVLDFAADLTGKPRQSFCVVTSQRETPTPRAPGDAALCDALAAVDLVVVHGASDAEGLLEALGPLWGALGAPRPAAETPEAVFRALHGALSGLPALNEALAQTSGRARALGALCEALFPGQERAEAATGALLTLGTLARRAEGEPGLLPTRLHLMFRGIHGLFACANADCAGARPYVEGGERAQLGKLFVEPRAWCDACGGRVFELISCRSCGAALLRGGAQEGALNGKDEAWLWGPGLAGDSARPVDFTVNEDGEGLTRAVLELKTGFVRWGRAPQKGERAIFLPQDAERGGPKARFDKCPECLDTNKAENPRINGFRTTGEPSFTALVETQFIEQPPQTRAPDPRLPNHGRKVLVFSDGRQRAARLAPALQSGHARDSFRQALVLGVRALEEISREPTLKDLYPAVLQVCAQRGLDLFLDADTDIYRDLEDLRSLSGLREALLERQDCGLMAPRLSYMKLLYEEVCDRFYSLWALGVATLDLHSKRLAAALQLLPAALEERVRHVILLQWIKVHLEERNFLPGALSPTLLAEQFYHQPKGVDVNKLADVVPRRFVKWLGAMLGSEALVNEVVQGLIRLASGPLLMAEYTRSAPARRYLKPDSLVLRLRLDEPWQRCLSCNRLQVDHVKGICPHCAGRLQPIEDPLVLDARSGFYRDKLIRALRGDGEEPFGLLAAEHSAQLSQMNDGEAHARTELYELRFQDIPVDGRPPLDVLSCTTTMEVGIDIGQLCAVALRNVPPLVANYQQRAGRAGRRGVSIASVMTWCQGGTHDAHYFDHPAEIISGEAPPPMVYIENNDILRRHVHAFLIQRFFHATVEGDPERSRLFEALGTVGHFLQSEEPCSFDKLAAWLEANRGALLSELSRWLPTQSHGRGCALDNGPLLEEAIEGLLGAVRAALPFEAYAAREGLEGIAKQVLERQLEENLLQALLEQAVLPRYAFPTDVVSLYVPSSAPRREDRRPVFDYQPSRDLQIALSEYAPGRQITIDGKLYQSAALYSPHLSSLAPVLSRMDRYVGCDACFFVEVRADDGSPRACPVCGNSPLKPRPFVIPPGFSTDCSVAPQVDEGGSVAWAGAATRAQLEFRSPARWSHQLYEGRLEVHAEPQQLVMVNKGLNDAGFHVCRECGLTEPARWKGSIKSRLFDKRDNVARHKHPTEPGALCVGPVIDPIFLGHRFKTDVLMLRLRFSGPLRCDPTQPAARSALVTLAEAVGLSASRVLQIEEGEVASWWAPVRGVEGAEALLYVYDRLPGGAGYARQIGEPAALRQILEAAEALLSGCACERSCYECLRHYQNQREHDLLDRRLGLELLRHITRGEIPALSGEAEERLLAPLQTWLELHGWPYARDVEAEAGLRVPLVVTNPRGDEQWVTPHHPLVPLSAASSPLQRYVNENLMTLAALDAWTLRHELPAACGQLRALLGVRP